ncbi:MAG: hypothetical protein ACOX63_06995 [Christensenellales bacterium]|jgi:hypothetical protein
MRYPGNGEEVTVPAELGGCPVKRIRSRAFDERKGIQSIAFPACMSEIEAGAIYDCDGLRLVYIPGAETALAFLPYDAVVHALEGSLSHQWCQKNKRDWGAWTPER